MSEFKPPKGPFPKGQSCANCQCWVEEKQEAKDERWGFCWGIPIDEEGDGNPYTLAYRWCGSWRGSAEVRCGGCKWHLTSSCPRGSRVDDLGQPGEFRGSYTNAFACERWEEATEKGAARES
jgi:hypothetical protein